MDTMTLLKNDPMALASDFDNDFVLPAVHEKFIQEGIARWHKKRAEEQERDGRPQAADGSRESATTPPE